MDRFITSRTPTLQHESVQNIELAQALGISLSNHSSPTARPRSPPKASSLAPPDSPRTPTRASLAPRRRLALLRDSPALFADSPSRAPPNSPLQPSRRVHSLFRVDAYGLRDDFYSTLLAYDPVNDIYAMGIDNSVRLWSAQFGQEPVMLPHSYGAVLCLAISSTGILAVAYANGMVCIYNAMLHLFIGRHTVCSPMTCLAWPATGSDVLYLGSTKGHLVMFKLKNVNGHLTFKSVLMGFKHRAQICSITLNPTGTYLSVGANDGLTSAWEVLPDQTVKFLYWAPHKTAVRAIAFCPWAPYLVATGGGRQDQRVRIWDIRDGNSMLYDFKVGGQVTALVWLAKWELFVGLGHGQVPRSRLIGAVFSLPSCQLVEEIQGCNSRTLIAVPALPHGVCCALSGRKLMMFQWKPDENPCGVSNIIAAPTNDPVIR
ncbi:Meiosis-specific APC/C activator protein AMA1 [Wickerhamiella sorbophila]|uniref:Meiosis-specific APC/C activator protein AMA1 n=1 Tax=Wickerhamiella sorbophila TaxID=45607 RepID=A0A2T0FG58_9ASCO|nr:Meiosis-specific APC/C activator protein AMA1 [Wickerhamiella sorbophila]PRT53964.1 Meiosis-specific APC/C activator protein AMA1 [Wickerhamiella sorbophila]